MRILVGSKNPTKIQAVKNVFQTAEVGSLEALSKVSAQPFSDEETMKGAVNRARQCAAEGCIGIGLEGGVMEINGNMYLCNWGALVDENEKVYLASGARIPLPQEVTEQLKNGIELGEVMDEYASKKDVRSNEGAIGIFTKEKVNREEMFTHVIKLLKGQYSFYAEKH